MFRLFGAEERDHSNRPSGKTFILQYLCDFVCDSLGLAIVSIMRIANTTLYIDVDQRRLNPFRGSGDTQWQDLILVEGPIGVGDDGRDTSEMLAQHDLVGRKDPRS